MQSRQPSKFRHSVDDFDIQLIGVTKMDHLAPELKGKPARDRTITTEFKRTKMGFRSKEVSPVRSGTSAEPKWEMVGQNSDMQLQDKQYTIESLQKGIKQMKSQH